MQTAMIYPGAWVLDFLRTPHMVITTDYKGLSWNYNQTIMSSNVNQTTKENNWPVCICKEHPSPSLQHPIPSLSFQIITKISPSSTIIHTPQKSPNITPRNSPPFPMATAGRTPHFPAENGTSLQPGTPEFRSGGGRHCPAETTWQRRSATGVPRIRVWLGIVWSI